MSEVNLNLFGLLEESVLQDPNRGATSVLESCI